MNQVAQTTEAIVVSRKYVDTMSGGLVRRLKAGNATVDLYVKQLPFDIDARTYNRLVTWGGWGAGHEFFLLVRDGPEQRVTVLRKWTLPFVGPGRLFLRGFLGHGTTVNTVSVRVTDGLDLTMVEEDVTLQDCYR